MSREVRVRFAPSPTGALHIGGVRTALYNYLFARKMGGKFLLRIEDTDQARFVPRAEAYIQESLAWLGISPDESPWNPGEDGPYRQSERKDSYMKYALDLVEAGHAYYAFDTSEELDAMRERLTAARVVQPQYNSITRTQMNNSLTLSEDEVKARLASGDPYVIRVKIPLKEDVRLNDMIRGWVMVHSSTLDDKVLMKSDGMPTYHLANIVDDHLMNITHVIRGEEWLPSAPLHVLLYKFFGWEETMPQFAHLPLLLKPDGNGKLSKRDGDKLGFPVFPLNWENKEDGETAAGFREAGYLPDAFLNFLAFLGWNPGDEREIFSMSELIEAFSMERIGKSGTKFDIAKAKWFNEQYLKSKSNGELAHYVIADAANEEITILQDTAEALVGLMKERVTFPAEIWQGSRFVVIAPTEFDQDIASKRWNSDAVTVLSAYAELLEGFTGEYDAETAKAMLNETAEAKDIKLGKVMQAVRLAVTGNGVGPDMMEIFAILGAEEAAKRIRFALATLDVIG
ncbi:glutamyl-tRNA synthetase [Algoriphagus ratkowskyi]|uniref:Glutamate--tRNA ligase n=1 Tax=Algoriphagus ratkowskyi TaxID=57028 RepID=A0A2W7RUU0_9BACT|nr:glutamate--tRNA ligase [Algoriphagus ratkowskyi]PZX54665.1 glutamyl-tRNA synthetase [Algoriphagus ratkowskyi]TXD76977.1 glutamate--tRNA ligase [Algoriphagus ratkowskyi]